MTREDSFVSLSQSDNSPQIFVGHKSMHKLSRQIVVNKMAEDMELIALVRERILETFQIESLRFRAGSVINVSQWLRHVPNSTSRIGKVFDFQSAQIFFDIVRLKCANLRSWIFSGITQ